VGVKIYFSGLNNVATPEILEYVARNNVNVLLSYFHHAKQNPAVIRSRWVHNDLFIDSGGFSVRMYGNNIPIERYRDWLVSMGGSFSVCANLDPLDMGEAQRNMDLLERAGLSPWPVYHLTEFLDSRWKGIIKSWCRDYEGVCVSGVSYVATIHKAGKRKKGKNELESPYHDYIFNEATRAGTKIHGLAATNQTLLKQYPFYSADSTTWKNSDRFGVVHEFTSGSLIHHAGMRTKTGRARHPSTQLPKTKRMIKSIEAWLKYESYLTALWAERGVSWG